MGVFQFKEKLLVFSSVVAAKEFCATPEIFLSEVMDVCRSNPELIHLLHLQEEFPICNLAEIQSQIGVTPLMVDSESQCPLHFIENNIDPQYCWNEWDLRKKALQMADIRLKATTGSQTDGSNMRRENETQMWPEIVKET